MRVKYLSSFLLILVICISCHRSAFMSEADVLKFSYNPATDTIRKEKKEIRGVWLTTVNNSDWPKTKGNIKAQKKELIRLLDMCKELHINTVILQIRPTADAFHPSSLEPWSYYLTGEQGKNPGYDPLKFAIEEVHKRGMDFHAWLNPYRIGWDSIPLAKNHIAVRYPSWVVKFKRNQYFNPGIPDVRQHLNNVVHEIVSNYEVDAIHFDDYFYPFGSKVEDPFVFNDSLAYQQYGNGKDITTWRTDNVNTMVQEVYNTIKSTKKEVLFGISPAGRRENSIALYADPFTWLENKWIDYLVPQVYWEFGHPVADFGRLADFWDENTFGISMIIGIPAYRFKNPSTPAFASPEQIGRQIQYTRLKNNLQGHFYFRTESLANPELKAYLKPLYPYPSLVPDLRQSSKPLSYPPAVKISGRKISWPKASETIKYAVYVMERDTMGGSSFTAHCTDITTKRKYKGDKGKSYFVTAVGVGNNESIPSKVITIR